jgi:hypothetical protein
VAIAIASLASDSFFCCRKNARLMHSTIKNLCHYIIA